MATTVLVRDAPLLPDRDVTLMVAAAGGPRSGERRGLVPAGLSVVLAIAALARLWNLLAWPVFVDEDVYTWVTHLVLTLPFPQNLVQSVWVTKPPLPFLLVAALAGPLHDPLLAGRVLAAISGIVGTGLTWVLARRFGGRGAALWAAGLYAVAPGNLLAERMALQDAPAAACSLLAVLLAWSAVERRSGWLAQAAALAGFVAVQVKLSAVVVAILPIALLWLVDRVDRPRVVAAFVAAAGPLLSYAALMASPWGDALHTQNGEVFAPLTNVAGNASEVLASAGAYLPFWPAILLGVVLLARRAPRLLGFLLLAVSAWLLPFLLFSVGAHARYYLPAASPYLCVLAAVGITFVVERVTSSGTVWPKAAVLIVSGTLLLTVWRAVVMVQAFPEAALSPADDWQYRSGWPAGTPYQAARGFLDQQAADTPVIYAVDIGHRVGVGVLNPATAAAAEIDDLAAPVPELLTGGTLVVLDDGRDGDQASPEQWLLARAPSAEPVAAFNRPGSQTGVRIYRVP